MNLTRRALPLVLAGAVAASAQGAQPSPERVYRANLAFAKCMRAHGVPHPDPDRRGDFHLTPADEARMRSVGRAKHEAAEKACFHWIKAVTSTKPLSTHARTEAVKVLAEVRSCVRDHGFVLGEPFVKNLTLGRAFFGFERVPPVAAAARKRLARAERTCEQRVRLAPRIDAIIAADRGPY
jgi:hypothetical protein